LTINNLQKIKLKHFRNKLKQTETFPIVLTDLSLDPLGRPAHFPKVAVAHAKRLAIICSDLSPLIV
jgi:hypothetical protein